MEFLEILGIQYPIDKEIEIFSKNNDALYGFTVTVKEEMGGVKVDKLPNFLKVKTKKDCKNIDEWGLQIIYNVTEIHYLYDLDYKIQSEISVAFESDIKLSGFIKRIRDIKWIKVEKSLSVHD